VTGAGRRGRGFIDGGPWPIGHANVRRYKMAEGRKTMSVLGWAERQAMLRRLMRVTRDRDRAEDCLQSAFVRLEEYRRHATVENEAGFLVRAATNIAIDEARRTRTRAEVARGLDPLQNFPDNQPLQDEVLLARERLSRARAALDRLPERTRTVFIMSRFAKMKYRDIAARLGIGVSAVEKHIAKASLSLANWIDDERDEAGRTGSGAERS
jgi:RNA polymerase sigma factor (sigma-70 family)